ncbi:hypothetical protein IFM89_036643 [Coptis chinensis]|uniref:RNase H type-1 domain-containing protein n=1 Tax=Coptis chinensis TaxID=261450 RepID=A0A835M8B4_9MAGN|nr:hypothetical protein IFM89_036643 [Coptis chinensis]
MGHQHLNVDGSSGDNAGNSGYGAVYRNADNEIPQVLCRNIGVSTSYIAEVQGILESIEMAISTGWTNLWVESDSVAAVVAFGEGQIPWFSL